jgi:hypothetical protein
VIEDNLDSVRSLVMLLKLDGHEAEFAINGCSAPEVAERVNPEKETRRLRATRPWCS